jgi:hypothetical protein
MVVRVSPGTPGVPPRPGAFERPFPISQLSPPVRGGGWAVSAVRCLGAGLWAHPIS